MSSALNISKVNSLTAAQFVSVFGNVVELCADAAEVVETRRPVQDVEHLCQLFAEYLENIDRDAKLLILKLHPDLAGRLAASGGLTKESTEEQKSAGLDQLTSDQKKAIDENNEKYKKKFGFPFVICARENKVQSIITGLQNRFHNTQDQEIKTAINEVKKICKLRILDIVSN